MRKVFRLAAGAASLALATSVMAQDSGAAAAEKYPDRPIRMVVGYAPGGGTDIMARALAKDLSEKLNESIVVENRPGAAQNIASAYVARATPDGYTLQLASSAFSVSISLYPKLDYDPIKDFAPVARFAESPNVLVVRKASPFKTVADLVAYGKANPGKLNYSSSGAGSTQHLSGELLQTEAGIKAMHIPYKGTGPSVLAVLSGEVDFSFMNIPSAEPSLKSGEMRALGITSEGRSSLLPDVPTMREAGVDMETATWYALLAPAGTPQAIVEKLNKAVNEVGEEEGFKKQLAILGATQVSGSTEQFKDFLEADVAHWAKVIEEAGIKLE